MKYRVAMRNAAHEIVVKNEFPTREEAQRCYDFLVQQGLWAGVTVEIELVR